MDEDQAPSESNQEEVKEADKSSSDPSDKLTPDHPRFKDVLERAKRAEQKAAKVDELEEKLKKLENNLKPNENEEDFDEKEYDAGDRIDKFLRTRKGYVTKEDLERYERIQKKEAAFERLNNKYNGKNGLPKFEADDVVAYAKLNGFGDNYESAYKDMHFETLVDIEAKRKNATPPDSEKPTGQDRQLSSGITREEIAEMTPEEFKKNEAKIDAAMKKMVGIG